MAQDLHFPMAIMSQKNSHMGQLKEKKIPWPLKVPQLQATRGKYLASHGILLFGKKILGKNKF